jgi:Xaa-Pro aminopeptidase
LNHRIQKVRKVLIQEAQESILVTDLSNIFYLSGFRGSDGALLITPTTSVLLVDGRYGTQAKEQAAQCQVVVYPDKISGVVTALSDLGVRKLAYESGAITCELFSRLSQKTSGVEWKTVGDWFQSLRSVKEPEELKVLREANAIADASVREILEWVKPGTQEQEVANELEYRMKKKGAERASFAILVAGGERAALPHARPTDRKLKSGEMFFLDFGCTFKGYQTDQTLTIALGEPSAEMKEIYSIVKEAHDRAMDQVKAGAMTQEIDRVAREFIASKNYKEAFNHGLGHGVGIEVHEYPNLSWRSNAKLEAGMLITIEPGIYLPGIGGVRIEDTIAVTETGYEVLTGVDKELLSL